jgi:hypothetical protein
MTLDEDGMRLADILAPTAGCCRIRVHSTGD